LQFEKPQFQVAGRRKSLAGRRIGRTSGRGDDGSPQFDLESSRFPFELPQFANEKTHNPTFAGCGGLEKAMNSLVEAVGRRARTTFEFELSLFE
jgi:hypothetical protein